MGTYQSLPLRRGRETTAATISRTRGTQGEAKISDSDSLILSDVVQQPRRSIIEYTSRVMREHIEEAYSFDFYVLRRDDWGRVTRVTCRRSGRKAEVLVVRKHTDDPLQLETLKKEIEIWLSLDHPHIARLLDVFEDGKAVYLVSEYCPGGSLYDRLAGLQKCPEEVARTWALQMTQALGFLQGYGIVHRNLGLQSWQLTSGDLFPPLKLYGLSHCTRWHKKEGRMNAACGLLVYTSPDVLLGHYTDACDMWSLGVIVYQLLCGWLPFSGSRQEIIRQILSGEVNMQCLEKSGVSEDAKSFVLQLLTISPHKRLTPQRALEHPWLFGRLLIREPFPIACITGLLSFATSSTLRRAALLTCAYCLNSDQSQLAERLFTSTTHSSTGCITMEDLRRTLQREQADPLAQEEVEDIFDALDINKDGEITFTVFAAAMIGTLVEPEDSLLQKAFAKLDIDGDGRLSLDDCRWAFGDPVQGESLPAVLAQEQIEDGPLAFSHFATMIREPKRRFSERVSRSHADIDPLPTQQSLTQPSPFRSLVRRSSGGTDGAPGPSESKHPQSHRLQRSGVGRFLQGSQQMVKNSAAATANLSLEAAGSPSAAPASENTTTRSAGDARAPPSFEAKPRDDQSLSY